MAADDADDRATLFRLLLADEGFADVGAPSIGRRPEGIALRLSFAQERMWFLSRLEPDATALNLRTAVRVRGPLNVDALRRAVGEVVARHEVLRTLIVDRGGVPVLVTVDAPVVPFVVCDVASDEELERALAADSARTFDLTCDLPLRVSVYRRDGLEHVVALVMHHIASDGWSIRVLAGELDALYTAFDRGEELPLAPLAVQYADYAHWQRMSESDDRLVRQLEYWKQQLAAPLPIFEIPPDFSRSPQHTYAGAAVVRTLDPGVVSGLREVARSSRATLFMVMLAAFELVGARHVGDDDVVVGIPVAGRVRSELEPLIGAFLNNLVLRTDLSGDPTFSGLVERVRWASLEAFDHQEVPFEQLLAELNPQRDRSRTPLFQIFFNMQEFAETPVALLGHLEHEVLTELEPDSKFDLTMYVMVEGDQIRLRCVYNRSLYRVGSMEELVDQYVQVLADVGVDPGRRISEYSLVTPRARPAIPDDTVGLDETWHGSVHGAVRAQARRSESIAIDDRGRVVTYGELAGRMNQLAGWLHAHHVERGDVVAIFGHRSASLVCAVLSAMAAGCTYVILDPRYPPSRLVQYLGIAKPAAWLQLSEAGTPPRDVLAALDEGNVDARIEIPADLASFDEVDRWPRTWSEPDETAPDDPACITFTSGSTGVPKAVLGRHGSLTHFLPWMSDRFEITASDRFSMLSGLAHDPLQRDMFWPLWLGATLVVPDTDRIAEPGWLANWLSDEAITVTHLTPAMGQLVAEGAQPTASGPGLRWAFFIGDVLTRLDVERLRQMAPSMQVVNMYGTTETQRASGYHLVVPADLDTSAGREVLPLGRGMPGAQLTVRTARGTPAGIGEVGDIWVRSPHLADGYVGDPTETEQRFVAHVPSQSQRDRTYRTGDRGRYGIDGEVEFLGRTDDQVQLRGFRIELNEIQAALGRHPAVSNAVVRRIGTHADTAQLVAYIVVRSDATTDIAEFRRHLATELPAHMIPAHMVAIDAIPLTPNGKLDWRQLPEPNTPSTIIDDPTDDLERLLVGIWSDVLDRPHVSINDNFFDIGGYSLLATRLFARIETDIGTRLPLSVLFESPTIADLAHKIRDGGWSSGFTSLVAVQPLGAEHPLFYVAPYTISVLQFAYLGAALAPDQPLYGFEPQGLDGRVPTHDRVEEMAAHYIREMKAVQPNGPYAIGGHCSGAWVAFEMAQQLEATGDELRCVVIVDRGPPGVAHAELQPFRRVFRRARFYFGDRRLANSVLWKLRTTIIRFRLLRVLQPPAVRQAEEVRDRHREAFRLYAGGKIHHDLLLVRSEEWVRLHDPAWYDEWLNLTTGTVRIASVPGTHATMLNPPHVRELAAQLRGALDTDSPPT